MKFSTLSIVLFTVVMIIGAADFSGDYIEMFGISYLTMPDWWKYSQMVSTGLIMLLVLIGVINLVTGRVLFKGGAGAYLYLYFYFASVIFGVVIALLKGNPLSYIIGDARNAIVYLLLFSVSYVGVDQFDKKLYKLFGWVCAIVLFKLFAGILTIYTVILSPQGLGIRLLLKLSSYLMSMTLISLSLMVHKFKNKYILMFVFSSLGTFLSQTRGFFLGLAVGFLALFLIFLLKKRAIRLIIPLTIICSISILTASIMWSDAFAAFGRWKGDEFDVSLNVRKEQVKSMMKLFKSSPIVGVGLGGYDPDYDRYMKDIRRPYLQELEYHNLLAKQGVVGVSLILSAFGFLFYECWYIMRRVKSNEIFSLLAGLLAGLIALIVASATNPLFSSIYFHLYIMIILLALSAARVLLDGAQEENLLMLNTVKAG